MPVRALILALSVLAAAAAGAAAAQPLELISRDLASRAHPLPVATDVNIITGIDVSDSITRHDEWLQYAGLARGVIDERFLRRVAEGEHRRVGFLAFTWSSGGAVNVVVPWTVIETPGDAARIANLLDTAPRVDRSGFGTYRPLSLGQGPGGMTDIAEALTSALQLSDAAPFPASRSVVNILSNGVDNNGQDPRPVRDQAILQGLTVNGIVFGGRAGLADYFRANIIGGAGAFLMEVEQPSDLPAALERKFWQDLIAALPVLTPDVLTPDS